MPTIPTLINVKQAHIKNSFISNQAVLDAEKIIKNCADHGLYHFFSAKKIPFLPLKGIVAPAFACEMGIAKPYDWQHIVEDLSNACITALENL